MLLAWHDGMISVAETDSRVEKIAESCFSLNFKLVKEHLFAVISENIYR